MEAVAAPANTRIANDAEEPGAPISADECPKISTRSQRRFLHGIFRIRVIPHQPARQAIGRIEVREDDLLKGLTGGRRTRGAGKAVFRTARRVQVGWHATSVRKRASWRTPTVVVQRSYALVRAAVR